MVVLRECRAELDTSIQLQFRIRKHLVAELQLCWDSLSTQQVMNSFACKGVDVSPECILCYHIAYVAVQEGRKLRGCDLFSIFPAKTSQVAEPQARRLWRSMQQPRAVPGSLALEGHAETQAHQLWKAVVALDLMCPAQTTSLNYGQMSRFRLSFPTLRVY